MIDPLSSRPAVAPSSVKEPIGSQVEAKLDQHAVQLGQLSPSQLAAVRSYGGQLESTIAGVQALPLTPAAC